MSKCGSNYKIANCTLEGGLIGAVSLSNTELFYLTSLFVLLLLLLLLLLSLL